MRTDRNPFYTHRLSTTPLDDFKKQNARLMKSRRFRVFDRDNYCCVACGAQAIAVVIYQVKKQVQRDVLAINPEGMEVMLTLDHIKPRAKGGPDRLHNLQTMCFPCNNAKADN